MSTRAPELFTLRRGDDFAFKVEVRDDQGNPVDVTGWTVRATMKRSFEDGDDAAPVAVDIDSLEGEDATGGIFHVLLPSAQTEALDIGPWFFDLQREVDEVIVTILYGRIRVEPDVTYRTAATIRSEALAAEAAAEAVTQATAEGETP